MNSLQVFRRHDIFVVDIQFHICLLITNGIRTTAYLHTSPPVGGVIHFMQREVALSGDCHTQSTVTEHLNTNLFTTRSTDIFFPDLTINLCNLLQIQFACKHHNIGKLGIKFQGFRIRYIKLSRQMHFLPDPAGIIHHCHVSSNHCRYSGCFGRIDNSTHQRNILIIDNRIDCQIAFHPVFVARPGYLTQIINGKRIGRTGTHVKVFYTKIDRIGSSLNGCRKRFARTDRRHYFKVFYIHFTVR